MTSHHYPPNKFLTNDQYQNRDPPDNPDLLVLSKGVSACLQRGSHAAIVSIFHFAWNLV